MKFEMSCAMLCAERQTVEAPSNGWTNTYGSDELDVEGEAFCPKHVPLTDWVHSQCSGCVGGFGDCDLFRAFAYSKMELSETDMKSIEHGICPRRVNGTIVYDATNKRYIPTDFATIAEDVAGKLLADSIREYSEKWHKK